MVWGIGEKGRRGSSSRAALSKDRKSQTKKAEPAQPPHRIGPGTKTQRKAQEKRRKPRRTQASPAAVETVKTHRNCFTLCYTMSNNRTRQARTPPPVSSQDRNFETGRGGSTSHPTLITTRRNKFITPPIHNYGLNPAPIWISTKNKK